GDEYCVDRQAQLRGHGLLVLAVHNHAAESPPSGRRDLRFHLLQKPAHDMAIMLAVPELAQSARGILELGEHLGEIAVSRGLRARLPRAPERLHPMHENRAEPASKSARPFIVLEAGQLAHDHGEDVLYEVFAVGGLEAIAPEPAAQQW